eukprot:1184383-Prorocentrum_minimum.AAC.5
MYYPPTPSSRRSPGPRPGILSRWTDRPRASWGRRRAGPIGRGQPGNILQTGASGVHGKEPASSRVVFEVWEAGTFSRLVRTSDVHGKEPASSRVMFEFVSCGKRSDAVRGLLTSPVGRRGSVQVHIQPCEQRGRVFCGQRVETGTVCEPLLQRV